MSQLISPLYSSWRSSQTGAAHLDQMTVWMAESILKRYLHVHEVDTSCRYISQLHAKPGRICKQVEEKKQACAHAHDHQSARQQAFDGYWVYQQEVRAKGSTGVVQ